MFSREKSPRARPRRHVVRPSFVRCAVAVCACLVVAAALLADALAFGESAPAGQRPQGSNRAAAARLASRQAFRHQSDRQALATARAKFPALLDMTPLRWPVLRPGERLARYLNDDVAVVSYGSGDEVMNAR